MFRSGLIINITYVNINIRGNISGCNIVGNTIIAAAAVAYNLCFSSIFAVLSSSFGADGYIITRKSVAIININFNSTSCICRCHGCTSRTQNTYGITVGNSLNNRFGRSFNSNIIYCKCIACAAIVISQSNAAYAAVISSCNYALGCSRTACAARCVRFNGIGFISANAYFAFRAIIFSRYFTASNFNISAAGIFCSGYNNTNRNSANSNTQRICFGNAVVCRQNSYIISFQFNTININFTAACSINFAYRRICPYNTCTALIYIKLGFAGNISANINFIRINAAAGNIYADIAIYVKDAYTCVNSRRACCTAAKCHIDVILTVVCADSVEEGEWIAGLEPDVMVCELTSLIGTGQVAGEDYMRGSTEAVKRVSPSTKVLQAAGISSGQNVYDAIRYGADGTGGTSGIVAAADPFATLDEMFEALDRARTDFCKEA